MATQRVNFRKFLPLVIGVLFAFAATKTKTVISYRLLLKTGGAEPELSSIYSPLTQNGP